MHWSARYIGLPWLPGGRTRDGVDCWGLMTLVYAEVAGVPLDPLNGLYVTAEEREDIARIVDGQCAHGPWVKVEAGDEREMDILLFRCFGLQSHVGVVCGRGLMLHATSGKDSSIERYADGRWLPRLMSAWRHEELA
ncbi:MAG: C40 family peptidase [Dechloromonas sp.]|nr:C40 family peptidase [Dechloromonas sp.]